MSGRSIGGLLLLLCACARGPAAPRPADAPPPSPPYVIIAPAEFVKPLAPLIDLRKAHVLTLAEIGGTKEEIRAKLAELRPTYALLVGDADRLPTWIQPGAYATSKYPTDKDLATDFGYADLDGDDREDIMIGRLPADSPQEVEAVVKKIIDYEHAPPGAWQKKLDFVVGIAGFDPAADAIIEGAFRRLVGGEIPLAYDLEVAYANPSSIYCWPPKQFNDHVIDLFNDGPLVFTYVGHGAPRSFDRLRATGDRVFDVRDVPRLAAKVPPIMAVLACSTAEFDAAEDCVGERAICAAGGPVAFLGGTRITQPYTNGMLGRALIRVLFDGADLTLGEELRQARELVRFGAPDEFQKMIEAFVSMYQGRDSLDPMRRDSIRHYNLFGDPALKVRRPTAKIELSYSREGEELVVRGAADDGRVDVTLELPRDDFPTKLRPGGSPDEMRAVYAQANDKVLARAEVVCSGGAFVARFPWPKERDKLVLKARSGPAAGALAIP